jgi:uncharacterized protein (DUF2249 family)
MEITRKTKLLDVLKAYPELEAHIITMAPPFKNLKNPVLRRTVAKLATLENVAQIGGLDVDQMVNKLREAAGQAELGYTTPADQAVEVPGIVATPDWVTGNPAYTIDGTEMLARGEVPLIMVNELLGKLSPGEYLLLITNFEPVPILEAMQKQNRRVYHEAHKTDAEQHNTYIGK